MPLWLLDIDGVVNALTVAPDVRVWPEHTWIHRTVISEIPARGMLRLPILAARPVLDFVAAAAASGRVDVRWHSTWRSAAVTDLAPALGLPHIPISVAPEWTNRTRGQWWKAPAALRALAAGRRLIWTDDDLDYFGDEVAAVRERPDALLIGPDPAVGLRPADLDAIAAFVGLPSHR
jgi:hypothetical protein